MNVKKGKWFFVALALAMIVAMVPAMVGAENGNDDCVILYAGQDIPVGTVCVTNDGENLYVTYCVGDEYWEDGEGWGLYETHVHVGKELSDFPLNRPGNPQIGRFAYKAYHEGVKCYTEVIPLGEWEADDELLIAAHAVIKKVITCEDPVVLLSTENNHPESGDTEMEARIWSITTTGEATLISNIPAPVRGTDTDNFNGNAFDDVNNRFYFSDYGVFRGPYFMGPSPLYFNDLEGNQEYAGDLEGGASGATFYDGAYYYIGERTDELRKVTFNVNGMIEDENVIANIFPDTEKVLAFGDVDIRDEDGKEVLYGSATEIPGFKVVFFKMDLDGTGYQVIKEGALFGAGGTQIAFGSDGVLYGVNARTPFELFSINPANGDTTFIKEMPVAFADLASGPVCEPVDEEETAWGDGDRFTERGNWATYFTYTVQEYLELVDSFIVDSADLSGTDSSITLNVEANYRIKVSGTWSNKPSNPHMVDAKYISFDNWDTYLEGYPDRDTTLLELMVDGEFVDWGPFNPDHIYYWDIEGKGSTVNIGVYDTFYGDNVGFFDVGIYRVW